jgi:hypothetical protein
MRRKLFWIPLLLVFGLFAGLAVANAGGGQSAIPGKKVITQEGRVLDKPEDIEGTIASVDTTEATVAITSKGVPYVFRVSRKTTIQINGQKNDLDSLKNHVNQNVSIHFVPRSEGNFALSINVTSSS